MGEHDIDDRAAFEVDALQGELPQELWPAPLRTSHGELLGVQVTQRRIIGYAHDAGFRDENLVIAAMVCGAESWRFSRAHNDNLDADGTVVSRDVGLMEINIPASEIGTPHEESLYDPETNFAEAHSLFLARGWQPWVAYNTKVYLHDTYLSWALLGLMNYWGETFVHDALSAAQTPKLKIPAVSLKQFKALYPNMVLGVER